jgi:hypothetical protein
MGEVERRGGRTGSGLPLVIDSPQVSSSQKRPSIMSKETYYATVEWITAGDRLSSGMPKET